MLDPDPACDACAADRYSFSHHFTPSTQGLNRSEYVPRQGTQELIDATTQAITEHHHCALQTKKPAPLEAQSLQSELSHLVQESNPAGLPSAIISRPRPAVDTRTGLIVLPRSIGAAHSFCRSGQHPCLRFFYNHDYCDLCITQGVITHYFRQGEVLDGRLESVTVRTAVQNQTCMSLHMFEGESTDPEHAAELGKVNAMASRKFCGVLCEHYSRLSFVSFCRSTSLGCALPPPQK